MEEYCYLGSEEAAYMERMYEEHSLTARTFHKVLRVARTIADLAGDEAITQKHLFEAVLYKSIDKKYWEMGV